MSSTLIEEAFALDNLRDTVMKANVSIYAAIIAPESEHQDPRQKALYEDGESVLRPFETTFGLEHLRRAFANPRGSFLVAFIHLESEYKSKQIVLHLKGSNLSLRRVVCEVVIAVNMLAVIAVLRLESEREC